MLEKENIKIQSVKLRPKSINQVLAIPVNQTGLDFDDGIMHAIEEMWADVQEEAIHVGKNVGMSMDPIPNPNLWIRILFAGLRPKF